MLSKSLSCVDRDGHKMKRVMKNVSKYVHNFTYRMRYLAVLRSDWHWRLLLLLNGITVRNQVLLMRIEEDQVLRLSVNKPNVEIFSIKYSIELMDV